MRIKLGLFLVGLGLASQGCGQLAKVARTIIIEPTRYPRRLDDLVDDVRNKQLAEEALQQFQEAHEETDYSPDFGLGFKAGYEDYLYAGGTGNPPPLPPRYYWRAEFESAPGHVAIQDWFAGFRQGAAVAKQSGYRELVTVPLPAAPSPPPLPAPQLPVPETMPEADAPPQVVPPQVLPTPRPVPPDDEREAEPPPQVVPPRPAPPEAGSGAVK